MILLRRVFRPLPAQPKIQTVHLQSSLSTTTSTTHDASGDSQYEDYNKTSATYDKYRGPIDAGTFLTTFAEVAQRLNVPQQELSLLDAGCGSGNHLKQFESDVGTVSGVEINDGMISKCRMKLPDADIQQGSITDLPVGTASVDVVITTQVLHHLETGQDQSFPNVVLAANEVFRCLRPGGSWIIQTQTPEQHVSGFWWAPVVPYAAQELSTRFAPMQTFEEICRGAGFDQFNSVVPDEPLVRLDKYLDLEGPFTQGFRNADSTWSLATEDELEKGLAMLREKIESGEAQAWLNEREQLRAQIGQTTTVVATKRKGTGSISNGRQKKFPFARSLSFGKTF